MISNSLKNTRVEFLEGSVLLDSLEATGDNPVLIAYKDCQIRFPQKRSLQNGCLAARTSGV